MKPNLSSFQPNFAHCRPYQPCCSLLLVLEDPSEDLSGNESGTDSESTSSDLQDKPTPSVLGESFIQNKYQQRLNNHPGTMANKKNLRSQKRKADDLNGNDSDATVSSEDITKAKLREAEMELARLKKRQQMSESSKKGRKIKGNSTESATIGLVWDTTREQFFPICKFLANDAQLVSATEWVLDRCSIEAFEGLEGKKLAEVKEEWIQKCKDKVLEAINSYRNYIQNQMKNKFQNFINEHGVDKLPTTEEIGNVALRLRLMDKTPNLERYQFVFDFYWDVLVPIVASHKRWGPGKRHHCLMSTGRPYGDEKEQLFVTPSDEAFTVLAWENYREPWLWKWEQKEANQKQKDNNPKEQGNDPQEEDEEDVDPRSISAYTTPNGGVQQFGGWNKAGRKRYRQLLDMIVKSKGIPNDKHQYKGNKSLFTKVEAIEKRALERIRKQHKIEDKKKAKATPVARQKDDVDSDHEVDWL